MRTSNLVLTVKREDKIRIGEDIYITWIGRSETGNGYHKIAIQCPIDVKIDRVKNEDVYEFKSKVETEK